MGKRKEMNKKMVRPGSDSKEQSTSLLTSQTVVGSNKMSTTLPSSKNDEIVKHIKPKSLDLTDEENAKREKEEKKKEKRKRRKRRQKEEKKKRKRKEKEVIQSHSEQFQRWINWFPIDKLLGYSTEIESDPNDLWSQLTYDQSR